MDGASISLRLPVTPGATRSEILHGVTNDEAERRLAAWEAT
ncbi:MAG: hypothetical protein ABI783_01715 [Actinomycetota bacterium]